MAIINVKVQFFGLDSKDQKTINDISLINKFTSTTSIQFVLSYFEELIKEELPKFDIFDYNNKKPVVQLLNKKISEEDDLLKCLQDYEVAKSCLLEVFFENIKKQESKPVINVNDEKNNTEVKKNINNVKETPQVEVFKPIENSKDPIITTNEDYFDSEEEKISTDDARKIQQLLKNKANSQSVYVKEKLEKEKLSKNKIEKIVDIRIRIKFPDYSITHLNLKSNDNIKKMIDLLNDLVLIKPFKFNLIIPNFNNNNSNKGKLSNKIQNDLKTPKSIYWKDLNDDKFLNQSLSLYNQVSFIFENIIPGSNNSKDFNDYKIDKDYKGPFTKSDSNKTVNDLLKVEPKSTNSFSKKLSSITKSSSSSSSSTGRRLDGSIVSSEKTSTPKWLKLSKK